MATANQDIIIINRLKDDLMQAEIVGIEWERVLLHIAVRVLRIQDIALSELDFYLVSRNYVANAKLRVDKIEGNDIFLTVNPTNPGYCRCLQNGTYTLAACRKEELVGLPQVSLEIAPLLEQKSRMLIHNTGTQGYSVTFAIAEDDEDMHLEIIAQDMKRSGFARFNADDHPDRPPVKWYQGLPGKIKKKLLSTKRKRRIIKKYYLNCLKKYRNKTGKTVLFISEQSETLGANLICIMEGMKKRGLDQQFEVLSSARNMVGKGGYGFRSWLRLMDKVAKADIMFVDDHVPFMDWLEVDPKTRIIQIWHAGAGYKAVGYSRWGHKGSPRAYSAHRQYDFGITPSHNIAFFFSEQFGINEEQILPTGMPRMDSYLDPEHRKQTEKKLYKEYPMLKDKKIVLFAPTYRGTNRKSAYYPYRLIDFDRFYELCGDEYMVLFKMHPWVSESVPIPEKYKDRFLDFNKYPNINDLYYIADLLITDYSSSVFEYSLMRRPMMFFAFDELQYSYSRGFHREYRPAAPGKICSTFDELMDAFAAKDFEFEKNAPYIEYHFDHTDSGATDRAIDWFILDQMPEETVKALARIAEENDRLHRLNFTCMEVKEDEAENEDE